MGLYAFTANPWDELQLMLCADFQAPGAVLSLVDGIHAKMLLTHIAHAALLDDGSGSELR